MSGTTIGGQKAAKINRERYGKSFYARIGAMGGRAGMGPDYEGGFASHRKHFCSVLPGEHKVSECAGKRGGQTSKRGKKYQE